MFENTIWIQHARRFIATDDENHLQQAIETCTDISLLSFLGRLDVREGNVPLDAHKSIVNMLETEQRFKEATVVKMLSVRDMAALADTSAELNSSDHELVLNVCSHFAELSRNFDFFECYARFVRSMGMLNAKRQNWKETLDLMHKALAGYKKLVSLEPQVYRPGLAVTLIYLGNILQYMGKYRPALSVYEQALNMYRQLAKRKPDIYKSYLGATLNNLGSVLLELKKFVSARDLNREALEIYRELAKSAPNIYQPYVGATSGNLGNILLKMCDFDSSYAAHTEAETVFRELSILEPIYKADLARTLNNLGNTLFNLRKCMAARRAYAEARSIYEELIDLDSKTYKPDLAMTLTNLANALRDTQEYVASHETYIQAEAIYRDIATTQPHIYRQQLATTLNNMSILLRDMRNFATSREVCDEAMSIRRELVLSGHEVGQSDVAATLNNLGNVLADLREYVASRNAFEEAVSIYYGLCESDQENFRPQLATSLTNLGNVLCEMKEFAASKDACVKAEKMFRELALLQPDAYQPGLAGALINIGNVLQLMGEFIASRSAYEEAERIYEQLVVTESKTYGPDIVMTLCNLGAVCERLGECSTTFQYSQRALSLTESIDVSPELRWLTKGKAFMAYRQRLASMATSGSADEVFRCLAAMRDGRTCALGHSESESLAKANHRLQSIEASLGHRLCVIVAQDIGSHGMILGILNGPSEPLKWWRLMKFKNAAEELFLEVATLYGNCDKQKIQKRNYRVATLAKRAWAAIPNKVQQILLPDSDYQQVLISGDRFWTAFCWEMLRYGSREGDLVGRHQLLSRWGGLTAEALGRLQEMPFGNGDRQTATVICPHNVPGCDDLSYSSTEALVVAKQLAKLGYQILPDGGPLLGRFAHRLTLRDALLAYPTVLHFSGHGTTVGAEESLLMWAEPSFCERHGDTPAPFGRREVQAIVSYLRSEEPESHQLLNHTLVVLNSCRTGGTRSYGGKREDLACTLLEQGAEVVVASPLHMHDTMGMYLGKNLYEFSATLGNCHFGQAFLAARRSIEERYRATSHWPTWSLLTYHGNPYARLLHFGGDILGGKC